MGNCNHDVADPFVRAEMRFDGIQRFDFLMNDGTSRYEFVAEQYTCRGCGSTFNRVLVEKETPVVGQVSL